MKRMLSTSLLGCCISLLLLSSCRHEVPEKEPEKPPPPSCRIKSITYHYNGLQDRSGTFVYNQAGNPVSITPKKQTTGNVHYEFRYDQSQRLTDLIGYYVKMPAGGYDYVEFWQKFYYDNNNRITRDTAYWGGEYSNPFSTYRSIEVTDYEYDQSGRIIKTNKWSKNIYNVINIHSQSYVYNANGNLEVPGAAYDTMVSVYRTNPIWMFLGRNYSRNNPVASDSYNAYGYPMKNPKWANNPSLFAWMPIWDCSFEYDCK
jgi:hypothetical protein